MAEETTTTETPEQKATRLEQELATKDAELRGYKTTLDALKTREEATPPATTTYDAPATDPTTGLNPSVVNALRSRGYKDEDIAFNIRLLNDFLPIAAQPFVAALAAIGDTADMGNFLAEEGISSGKDALTIKEEVEKLRKADIAAGRQIRSRKDYGIAVKARRAVEANSPDAIEKIVQQRVDEELRKASGASATVRGSGASSQNAGPGPSGGGGRSSGPKSRAEIERMSAKERREYIESLGDDFAA